jgi:nucleotide-binding universal stress UspA family protein
MFNTILVAFKFSQGGKLALEAGVRLATEQRSDLHVFHALDYKLQQLAATDPEVVNLTAECETRFREEALPNLNNQVDPEFICLPDDPAMGICTLATDLRADLIILGEHQTARQYSLGRLDYIGMTVVEKAPCPVMIVPFR